MKKKVLFIAAIAAGLFTSSTVNAQDFKPEAGDHNIEVNFAPLGGNPITINNLRFRHYLSSDMAVRVGFSVTSASKKTPTDINISASQTVTLEDKNSSFGFSINPGIEKHFEGTDRLSPYVGAEILFSTVSTKEIDQQLDADPSAAAGATYESETTGGSTSFGLNLLVGTDWYFIKHMYMGVEVGFGFLSKNNKDQEVTNPTGNGSATATSLGTSNFNLGPNFNSAIRLGFQF